jgi:hypothetical protein
MKSNKMMLLSLLLNFVFIVCFVGLGMHYRWIDKVTQRISRGERPRSQDLLTTVSWSHTMESLSYDADIVLFGASITSDGHWQDYFDSLKICNLGKSGDRLEMMLWRIPQITAVHPQRIFLSMEQNDMHDLSIGEIEKAYNILLDSIIVSNPQAKLYLESLTPLNERQFRRVCDNKKIKDVNDLIRRIARERDVPYLDIYSLYVEGEQLPMSVSTDGQHLKPEVYDRWAELIKAYIEE